MKDSHSPWRRPMKAHWNPGGVNCTSQEYTLLEREVNSLNIPNTLGSPLHPSFRTPYTTTSCCILPCPSLQLQGVPAKTLKSTAPLLANESSQFTNSFRPEPQLAALILLTSPRLQYHTCYSSPFLELKRNRWRNGDAELKEWTHIKAQPSCEPRQSSLTCNLHSGHAPFSHPGPPVLSLECWRKEWMTP